MQYNPTSFEIHKSLKNSIDLLASIIQSKDILIINNLKADCVVCADQQMIHSVLLNLLSNAVKFSYPGGKISISCKEIASNDNYANVTGKEIAGFVEISITDFGEGISDEEKNKLFSINNQYTRPGTMNEQGVGLGLILVKEMVEKHGTRLTINSEPGKGSEFSFTLPVESN
jgi:signal transduction histidine kinase